MRQSAARLLLIAGLALASPLVGRAAPLEKPAAPTDAYGDPLPEGALARIGTARLRHGNWAIMAVFSPDGKLLASSGNDRLVRLWDSATGLQVREFAGHLGWVNSVAF